MIRYQGDVRDSLPRVLGGGLLVVDSEYDEQLDVTLVQVKPLIDPLKAAGIDD